VIYLDNSATSFPKPRSVCEEMNKCMRFYCGNPGRGAHTLSMAAAEKVYECREKIASLFGCKCVENIIFTLNTSYAINIVLKGILKYGDHVILSNLEHNSVYRPIYKMAKEKKIQYDIFDSLINDPNRSNDKICSSIEKLIRANTKLLICTHASNICSAILPIKEIADLCHKYNILFAIDAAQSAGHVSINMDEIGIDVICAPAHKGLLGPSGCGIIILRNNILLNTLIEGGSGVTSMDPNMPDLAPERYEVGTLGVPAIAGLCEGINVVKHIGIENISTHEKILYLRLHEMLNDLKNTFVYTPQYIGPILLFNIKNMPAELVEQELNKQGICVRSGFHCAPLAHKTVGTGNNGAVRISFGIYNTLSDVEFLYSALKSLIL